MFGAVGAVLAAIQQKKIIKSIQSGIAAAAGNVTINAVDTTKAMVLSASKGSAGYVAARGNISVSGSVQLNHSSNGTFVADDTNTTYSHPASTFSGSLTGGSTDLTVKVYSARLVNSTTIYCDGPVEWQVIEFG